MKTKFSDFPEPDINKITNKVHEAESDNFWRKVDNNETNEAVMVLILNEINKSQTTFYNGEQALMMLGRLQGLAQLINMQEKAVNSVKLDEFDVEED